MSTATANAERVTLLVYESARNEGEIGIVGALGGLALIGVVVLVLGLRARSNSEHQSKIVQRHLVDGAMADDARSRFVREQEQANYEAWYRAWYAAETAVLRYCEGCSTNRSGIEMIWTAAGRYRCRACAEKGD